MLHKVAPSKVEHQGVLGVQAAPLGGIMAETLYL